MEYNRKTPEGERAYQNAYNRKLRKQCLDHYGSKCACCDETQFEFLALDHKNKDGKKQREIHGTGRNMCMWIIRNNYPEGFRVLCHNCNNAHGFYGYCPHDFTRTVRQQLDAIREKNLDTNIYHIITLSKKIKHKQNNTHERRHYVTVCKQSESRGRIAVSDCDDDPERVGSEEENLARDRGIHEEISL